MSRIGKSPVKIPEGVNITLQENNIIAKGNLGELSYQLSGGITAEIVDNSIVLSRKDDTREQKTFHGLNRALVNNMVVGVSEGFSKTLHVIGTGYSAEIVGPWLKLALGYSHDILMQIPEGIKVETEAVPRSRGSKNAIQVIIKVNGIEKEEVGKFAAEIRKCRKPENYKGKGIRYADEFVRIKAGKSGGKK